MRRRIHKRFACRGTSILEVLFALAAATVICSVVVYGTLTGIRSEARAQENILAVQCARQVIENVRYVKNANVATGTYSNATSLGPVPQLSQLKNGTVAADVSTYSGTTLQVVVTVTWQSKMSHSNRSTIVSAFVAPNGVSL